MNDYPATRGARPGDPHLRLRLAALIAVIAGVVLVAAAAFLLSYTGIHQIALHAGVSPRLARLYPLMFDAMLVVTCAAVLALRNAGWGTKFYVWVCLLLVLAAVAAGDALHATGFQLTGQAARAAIAVIPWVLLLMGFGIWLAMLRQWRRARAAAAVSAAESSQAGRERPATGTPAAAAAGAGLATAGRGATPTRPGNPSVGIDALLQRDGDRSPDRTNATEAAAAGAQAQQEQQRTAEQVQNRAAAGTAKAAVAGAAVAGTGSAGTRQNGATGASHGRGRKDKAEDPGHRTRLGGLPKEPDSKLDEDEDEGSVRILPAEPKAPAEGADAGKDSPAAGTQAEDAAAKAGDSTQAKDTAAKGEDQAKDTAAKGGDKAAKTWGGARARGTAAGTGDTGTKAGNGAKTGNGDGAKAAGTTAKGADNAATAGDGARARGTAAGTGDTAATAGNGSPAGDTVAKAGNGAQTGDRDGAGTADTAQAGDTGQAGDTAQAGDTTHGGDSADAGSVSPPVSAVLDPHFDRLGSAPTPPGDTGTSGE